MRRRTEAAEPLSFAAESSMRDPQCLLIAPA
jgi:hypothetical protein